MHALYTYFAFTQELSWHMKKYSTEVAIWIERRRFVQINKIPANRQVFYLVLEVGHRRQVASPACLKRKYLQCFLFCAALRRTSLVSQKDGSRLTNNTRQKTHREGGVFVWWNFTTPLEPILRKNANSEPRRLSSGAGRAPPAAPFAFF